MKIMLWNVNGLRAILKKNNINGNQTFIEFISHINPDILCLNETKLSTLNKDNRHENILQEYMYHTYTISTIKKGYSGVAIYSKYKHIKTHKEFDDDEGRCICLEYNEFILINVYVPNASIQLKRNEFKHRWMTNFINNINKLKQISDKPILIAGDFNCAVDDIDVFNPSKHHNSPGFTDIERYDHRKLLDIGFTDPYRHKNIDEVIYTYFDKKSKAYSRNHGWYIDKILISSEDIDIINNYSIIDVYGPSDHIPLMIDINKFE